MDLDLDAAKSDGIFGGKTCKEGKSMQILQKRSRFGAGRKVLVYQWRARASRL